MSDSSGLVWHRVLGPEELPEGRVRAVVADELAGLRGSSRVAIAATSQESISPPSTVQRRPRNKKLVRH